MKTRFFHENLLYYLLVFSMVFVSGIIYAQEEDEHLAIEKFEQWFIGQRMSPLDTIRKDAYSDAVNIGISLSQFSRSNPGLDEWISLGPQPGECSYGGEISGRVQTVFYHPSQANTIFIGGANGGVIKSVNGGIDWQYKYNGLTSLSSGCIIIDPNEPSYMYYGSGEAVIKYINIMTDSKDSAGVPEKDYEDLINSYLKGDKLQGDYPHAKNRKKRLYEEDNQLCGEVKYDFDDITQFKFYKYKDKGPWCYYVTSSLGMFGGEQYFSYNGTYGGADMPVIFWDGKEKEFKFKTTVSQPAKNTMSLLDLWKSKGEK